MRKSTTSLSSYRALRSPKVNILVLTLDIRSPETANACTGDKSGDGASARATRVETEPEHGRGEQRGLLVQVNSCTDISSTGVSCRRDGRWQRGLPDVTSLVRSQSENQARWQLQLNGLDIRFLRMEVRTASGRHLFAKSCLRLGTWTFTLCTLAD